MASSREAGWVVKFVPFSSSVESSFWVRHCQEKLDTIKLNEDPIDVLASYSALSDTKNKPRLLCREASLDPSSNASLTKSSVAMPAQLIGYNTTEKFQKVDKNKLLRDAFLPKFLAGDIESCCSVQLLTYADLKAHKVLFWFAIPALMSKVPIRALKEERMLTAWNPSQCETFSQSWKALVEANVSCPAYFLVTDGRCQAFSKEAYHASSNKESVVFGFVDPCNPDEIRPEQPMGWPLRNFLAYLSLHLEVGGTTVQILSYRPKLRRREKWPEADIGGSILLRVKVPNKSDYGSPEEMKAVGWELNARSKPGPRWVNLAPLLDTKHLAIQAADLNLKLMKWRMIPNLDVDMLQSTKVLLLGAGTLGCNVARVLLGWGIRQFKIVDYGKVSYSNPVRQSLFTLSDCEDGGKPKAVAASDALRSIAADVDSEGVVLSIPMPGHSDDQKTIQSAVEKLDEFVQEADVVFLLTDTRESRWLPTVMAAAHDKLLINAALGLDSWLVMRHGGGLGCYYCNDVVAPENSMKNRTLDQQCTVTRPGLAPIASSMAVELMVALLHHPRKHKAPAPESSKQYAPTVDTNSETSSTLGVMPHQIRGSIVSYTMMTPTVPAFSCCTGCSEAVVDAYRNDKVKLVQDVCESTNGALLEDLSGWTAFRAEAAEKMDDMDEDFDWDE